MERMVQKVEEGEMIWWFQKVLNSIQHYCQQINLIQDELEQICHQFNHFRPNFNSSPTSQPQLQFINLQPYQFYYTIHQMNEAMPQYNHNQDNHYLVRVDKDFKCICQLCSCGKHKCPRPKAKGSYGTSYGEHYQNYIIKPQISQPQYHYQDRHYNPQEAYLPQQPVATQTASRLQHIGREVLKSGPFVSDTSYKDQYKPFQIEPGPQGPPLEDSYQTPRKAQIKFEGVSAYKSQFDSPKMPKIERYKHPQTKNPSPFIGESSYKSQFLNFKVEPSYSMPMQAINSSRKVKFQGSSTYNQHFKTFQMRPINKASGCQLDSMPLPPKNYSNQSEHVFYDHKSRQFI